MNRERAMAFARSSSIVRTRPMSSSRLLARSSRWIDALNRVGSTQTSQDGPLQRRGLVEKSVHRVADLRHGDVQDRLGTMVDTGVAYVSDNADDDA